MRRFETNAGSLGYDDVEEYRASLDVEGLPGIYDVGEGAEFPAGERCGTTDLSRSRKRRHGNAAETAETAAEETQTAGDRDRRQETESTAGTRRRITQATETVRSEVL